MLSVVGFVVATAWALQLHQSIKEIEKNASIDKLIAQRQVQSAVPIFDRSMLNNVAFECSPQGTKEACNSHLSTLQQYLDKTKP